MRCATPSVSSRRRATSSAFSRDQPSARYLTDVAYDTKRDVLVLFGGGDPAGSSLFADTWEFDGTTWRRVREK